MKTSSLPFFALGAVAIRFLAVVVLWSGAAAMAEEGCGVCAALHSAADLPSEFAVATFTTGTKRLAVIRVDFEDLPGAPSDAIGELSVARLTEAINGPVASFYRQNSYGKATVSLRAADVTDVLRLPELAKTYAQDPALGQLETDALDLAARAGYDFSSHDRIAFLTGSLRQVPGSQVVFRAFAGVGGRHSWFQGDFSPGLVAHELGHNYGLGHASSWLVEGVHADPLHPDGEKVEYGNAYDIMGRANLTGAFESWLGTSSLAYLGWLPESAYRTVREGGAFRIYRYDHPEADMNQTLGIRVPLPTGRAYWMDYRHAFAQSQERLMVVRADETNRTTLLLDMQPGGTLDDAGLAVGGTFTEQELGLSARVVAAGGTGLDAWLDVEVAFVPEVRFRKTDLTMIESAGKVTLLLDRYRSAKVSSTVRWTVVGDTATLGEDVASVSGVVRWEAQDTESKVIEIPVLADLIDEGEERFIVRLSEAEGAVLPVTEAIVHVIEPGVPDPLFEGAITNGRVRDIGVQANGGLVLVGDFERVEDEFGRGVGRLLPSGAVDTSFAVSQGMDRIPIRTVLTLADGKILCGGAFERYDWDHFSGLVRLFSDSSADDTFVTETVDGEVFQLLPADDSKVLVAGTFSQMMNHPTVGVARLLSDGAVDELWSTDLPSLSRVTTVVALADGEVVAGGWFPLSGEDGRWGAVLLNARGKQVRWLGDATGEITKLRKHDGNALVMVGSFDAFGGILCPNMVRFDRDGAVDRDFVKALGAGPNGAVWDLVIGREGESLIAGDFDAVAGQTREGLARLHEDGRLDFWDPGTALRARTYWNVLKGTALALQADGNVVVALTNSDHSQGWLARVANGGIESPGVVEFETTSWTGRRGEELTVPILRRRGDQGEISVEYRMVVEPSGGATNHTTAAGRLVWAHEDTQPRAVRLILPTDPHITSVSLVLRDPQGGAQVNSQRTARITLPEMAPSALWLYENFGGAVSVASAFTDDEDADQDGVSNLLEYALDRDPSEPATSSEHEAYPKVFLSESGPTAEQSLEMLVDLPSELRPDVRYEILMGDGVTAPEVVAYYESPLSGWVTRDGSSVPYRLPHEAVDRQRLRFREPIALEDHARCFMQLRVRLLR